MAWKLTKWVTPKQSYEVEAPVFGWKFPAGSLFTTAEETPNPSIKKVTTIEGKVGYVPTSALIEI